jgi:hypothetical protein
VLADVALGSFATNWGCPRNVRHSPTRTLLDAVGTSYKKERPPAFCHKRPKSREETPKEGSDSAGGSYRIA